MTQGIFKLHPMTLLIISEDIGRPLLLHRAELFTIVASDKEASGLNFNAVCESFVGTKLNV